MTEGDTAASAGLPRTLFAALCAGYFLILLDVTVVNVALPAIGHDLSVSGTRLAWVVDAYAVPLAALLLPAGALGDRLGHKRIVLLGLVGFGVSSIGCALAQTIEALALARAVQGAAAAVMLPGTLALIAQSAADDEVRARRVALWAALGGLALPAGPLLGGLLVSGPGWPSVFWLNVPVIAIALAILVRLPSRDAASSSAGVDWLGAGLLTVTVGATVFAVLEGAASVPIGVVAGVAAVVAGTALVRQQRGAAAPLLAVPRAERRGLVIASGVAGLMNLCMVGSLFVLTQVLQVSHGLRPWSAGLMLLPAMVPLPLLGPVAGRISVRIGAWRTSAIGLALAATGFAGLCAAVPHRQFVELGLALMIWGCGVGILTPAIVAVALGAARSTPGSASGASNTARQIGGALGVAVMAAAAGPAGARAFLAHVQLSLAVCGIAFAIAAAGLLRVDRNR
ncbi:MFS transporter [Jongsikchunia kroppenstedtii]|uniref:MFS transporter n=1 Tax=Jongsikchunia kroppenstedtii TaxID=1121721 RepID=UPI0003698FAA|nr:MFS transporter [Jongsikchunia kroppenstedtii]